MYDAPKKYDKILLATGDSTKNRKLEEAIQMVESGIWIVADEEKRIAATSNSNPASPLQVSRSNRHLHLTVFYFLGRDWRLYPVQAAILSRHSWSLPGQ